MIRLPRRPYVSVDDCLQAFDGVNGDLVFELPRK